jgi:hypothetical protein
VGWIRAVAARRELTVPVFCHTPPGVTGLLVVRFYFLFNWSGRGV